MIERLIGVKGCIHRWVISISRNDNLSGLVLCKPIRHLDICLGERHFVEAEGSSVD